MSLLLKKIGTTCRGSEVLPKSKRIVTDNMYSGFDNINGMPIEASAQAAAVASNSGQRIGHVYRKALFRQYTNDSFTEQSSRPQVSKLQDIVIVSCCQFANCTWGQKWLGILGPIIRAEVGDIVKVVFKNMASNNHTMHPHGLRYVKENEGLSGAGQEFGGDAVPPGATWTYTWEVPGE